MICYPASKSKYAAWWKAMRAAGVPIVASWIDSGLNTGELSPSPDVWREHWGTCIEQAAAADVCLFVDMPGENQCGAIAELGASLAAGRQVYIVSQNFWSIEHHPRCRKFRDLEAAITAIMAPGRGVSSIGPLRENAPATFLRDHFVRTDVECGGSARRENDKK
jgi:hypothetical protein